MHKRTITAGAALLFAAGCAIPSAEFTDGPPPVEKTALETLTEVGNIPESVARLAAPDQDLSTARFMVEDGCYWYEHSGPVEVTLVPLRSEGGSPICLKGYVDA